MKCLNCGNNIVSKHAKKFCGRSCAATHNNKLHVKIVRKNSCVLCSKPILSNRTYCKKCYDDKRLDASSQYTVGQIRNLYKDKSTMAVAAKIRGYSKAIYDKSGEPKQCCICGYDVHYQVSHIKAVKSFSDDTPMSVVNSIHNLIPLCPNHHWEFDHNLFQSKDRPEPLLLLAYIQKYKKWYPDYLRF